MLWVLVVFGFFLFLNFFLQKNVYGKGKAIFFLFIHSFGEIAQAGLQLLGSIDLSASASQVAEAVMIALSLKQVTC